MRSPTTDRPDTTFYADVDNARRSDRLLAAMDATASWPAVRELRAWTEAAITGGDSLLDVGCGLADAAIDIARRHPDIAVTGVDSSQEMIDEAGRRAASGGIEITLRRGDATDLPFDDGAFDAARCERVLQWLERPQAAVDEIVRVVAPGGTVALLDTDWRTFASTVADHELERSMAGPWPTPGAGGFLRTYALAAGLDDVRCRPVVHHAHHIRGDASDGLFPFDQYLELQLATGRDAGDAERYVDELRRQSNDGTLTLAVTMWAAVGRVPRIGDDR